MSKINFNDIIPEIHSYKDIFLNKGLAKLGDPFVNLLYSLSKSVAINKISGQKVAGKILMQALKDSDFSDSIPSRLSSHDIADAVEAIIVYVWLIKKMSLTKMTEILISELKLGDFSSRRNEFDSAILAFTKILNEIKKLAIF